MVGIYTSGTDVVSSLNARSISQSQVIRDLSRTVGLRLIKVNHVDWKTIGMNQHNDFTKIKNKNQGRLRN